MHFELSIGTIWMLISLAGVFIPLVGIFVLMGKEQSKSSTYLMIANIGCLIMNGAYFLLLQTGRPTEATMALKMEYLGNFLFYFFFIKFILSYMQIDVRHKWVRIFTYLWMFFEVAVIAVVWDDTSREEMFAHHNLEVESKFGYHFFNMQGGIVYKIRYGFLLGILLCLIAYMIIKRVHIRKQSGDEKHNLSHLIAAKFVIIIPLIMEIMFQFSFKFVPVFSSIAVLLIILSVVEGDIFSVLDIGRGWVIENFEAVFIIADRTYGYLDSNKFAKEQFAELDDIHKGEKFSEELKKLFLTEETEIVIKERHYERFLKN